MIDDSIFDPLAEDRWLYGWAFIFQELVTRGFFAAFLVWAVFQAVDLHIEN